MGNTVKLNESEFMDFIRIMTEEVCRSLTSKHKVREVKYFHPSGKSIPNGSHVQRGGFLHECKLNRDNYRLDEAVHPEQYGLADYRGGIITFSTDLNAVQLSKNVVLNKIKQTIETFKQRLLRFKKIHNLINRFNEKEDEYIGAYSVGNFFHGKYVGDNGEMFNEKSLSIEINGLSSKSLVRLAEDIADEFKQETVLVKDLNKNKIFLVDSNPSTVPLDKEMERINVKA